MHHFQEVVGLRPVWHILTWLRHSSDNLRLYPHYGDIAASGSGYVAIWLITK